MPHPSSASIVWLFNSIGTTEGLLYWEAILKEYLQHFPRSRFFTATPPGHAIPGTAHEVTSLGLLRIPLGKRHDSYPRRLDLASPGIVAELIRHPPDVLVISEFLSLAMYVSLAKRFLRGTRVLLLLESDPIRGLGDRDRKWRHRARRWIAGGVDQFLTNNGAGRDYLITRLGIPPGKILTKPYLVSAPPENAGSTMGAADNPLNEFREGTERTRFLAVGQLIPRKGMRQLIDAVETLPAEVRSQMEVWIVGDGPERGALEARIESTGLSTTVRLLGPRNYGALCGLYRAADVMVMPTLDDYRALVGFEALAQGLPLLHSRFDGAVEELLGSDGDENGRIIDPRDPHAFAAAIRWMVEHPLERRAMGQISLRRAQRFTVNAAVEAIVEGILLCQQPSAMAWEAIP